MRLKQFTLLVLSTICVLALSTGAWSLVFYVMDKEIARQASAQKALCDNYAAEINAHAGYEVCAPTTNG